MGVGATCLVGTTGCCILLYLGAKWRLAKPLGGHIVKVSMQGDGRTPAVQTDTSFEPVLGSSQRVCAFSMSYYCVFLHVSYAVFCTIV